MFMSNTPPPSETLWHLPVKLQTLTNDHGLCTSTANGNALCRDRFYFYDESVREIQSQTLVVSRWHKWTGLNHCLYLKKRAGPNFSMISAAANHIRQFLLNGKKPATTASRALVSRSIAAVIGADQTVYSLGCSGIARARSHPGLPRPTRSKYHSRKKVLHF